MRFDNTEKIISKYFDEKLLSNVAVKSAEHQKCILKFIVLKMER